MPIFRKYPSKNKSASKPAVARKMRFTFRQPIKRDLPFPFNNPYILLAAFFVGSVLFLSILAMMFAPRAMSGSFMSGSGSANPTYMSVGAAGRLVRAKVDVPKDPKAKAAQPQEWSLYVKKQNIGFVGTVSINKKECMTRSGWTDVMMAPCGGKGQKWLIDFKRHVLQSVDESGKATGECLSSQYSSLNHGTQLVMHDCGKGVSVPESQQFKFKSGHPLKI